jgi:hypothetical protein
VIVMRWLTSPAPSVPRVSHPLNGFHPTGASWFCFTPHPSIGFWPPELFPLSQP